VAVVEAGMAMIIGADDFPHGWILTEWWRYDQSSGKPFRFESSDISVHPCIRGYGVIEKLLHAPVTPAPVKLDTPQNMT
jgi:hypothetical protein